MGFVIPLESVRFMLILDYYGVYDFCYLTILTAEALGYTSVIPAFLDPTLTSSDLLHGVSFASAGSGYDELTSNLSVSL